MGYLETCLEFPAAAEHLREDLKDKEKLRLCVARLVSSPLRSVTTERVEEFKRKFGVSDEAMLVELMDIIREGSVKAGWTKHRPGDAKNTYVSVNAHLSQAILWLGFFSGADAEVKSLMMDIATDIAMDCEFRSLAVGSYMSRANVQETRDAVARFLADDMQMADGFYRRRVYHAVTWAYDKAEGDTQTREGIIAVLSAALVKEEDKNAFAEADKFLAERSKEYADSPQRKAALERMNKPPEKETP